MPSYGQSITVTYLAWNTSSNAYQTGDVANHTLKLVKDGTEASPTNSPAEVDATNCPGLYSLVLTTAECQHNVVAWAGKSSTANVVLIGSFLGFEQLPTALDANGFVKADVEDWKGSTASALTGDPYAQLNTLIPHPFTYDSNNLPKVDLVDIAGAAVATGAAQLGVNVVNIAGQAAVLDGNNLLEVDVVDWKGSAAPSFPTNFGSLLIDSSGHVVAGVVRENTAQAGGASTITLDAGASATNSFYNNATIWIYGGTGAGQVASITGYVGSTKVATVSSAWATAPDNTSQFRILAAAAGSPGGGGSFSTTWTGGTFTDGNTPEADVLSILAKVNLIGAAGVSFSGPSVSATGFRLIIGDDYLTVDGRELSWSASTWPNLTSGGAVLNGVPGAPVACAVTVAGTSSQTVTCDLSHTKTSAFTSGPYEYSLVATLSDASIVTLAQGLISATH